MQCERCSKDMPPAKPPSARRRFCSLACANKRGLKGQSRTATMVRARKSALRDACECCGGAERLAIHHVNENWKDERPRNLQTLCVYCHQQWHGLHRQLGIPCRIHMPKLSALPVKTYTKIKWGKYVPK